MQSRGRKEWEMDMRASRQTLPYSPWNSWNCPHLWTSVFTLSQAQIQEDYFSLGNGFYQVMVLPLQGTWEIYEGICLFVFVCFHSDWGLYVLLVFRGLETDAPCPVMHEVAQYSKELPHPNASSAAWRSMVIFYYKVIWNGKSCL